MSSAILLDSTIPDRSAVLRAHSTPIHTHTPTHSPPHPFLTPPQIHTEPTRCTRCEAEANISASLIKENESLQHRLEEAEVLAYANDSEAVRHEENVERLKGWISHLHQEMFRLLGETYSHSRLFDQIGDILHHTSGPLPRATAEMLRG